MSIIATVLIICPGIMAAEYYQRVRKEKDSILTFVCNAALFIFLINFVDIALIYLRGWDKFSFDTMGAGFMVKYMAMSLVMTYVMPHVYKIVAYVVGRYITGSIKKQ